jgi:hypothetical protein
MEFCLTQGSIGPEIGMLIDDLRALGLPLERGVIFTAQVVGALKMFQQSHHDHLGKPLKIDGRLGTSTALALDAAQGRARRKVRFNDTDLPPMSQIGSASARRVTLVALAEYMSGCGEQGGDNVGPDIARYQCDPRATKSGWSVDFALHCLRETFGPESLPHSTTNHAQDLLDVAKANGWTLPIIDGTLLPGDLIVWHYQEPSFPRHPDWTGQVGIVWSCEEGNIITLEGNRGPYPSLVRPFYHKLASLLKPASNSALRDSITIVRVS